MSSCPALCSAFTCSSEVPDLAGVAGRLQGVERLAQHRDSQGEVVAVAELEHQRLGTVFLRRGDDDVVVAQHRQSIELALRHRGGADDRVAGVEAEQPDVVFEAVDAAVRAPWRQLNGGGQWRFEEARRAADDVAEVGVVEADTQSGELAIDGALEFAAAIAAEIGEFVQGASLCSCGGQFRVQPQV